MIGKAGRWTQTPSATHLQPQKWNAHFWVMFNFWWSARLVSGLKPHLPPLSSQKHEMLVFGLHSTSDDQPGWSMDLNPICHLSPAKKLKCSFLDYIQLLMIAWAGRWTWTPSTTSLQPKKWNAHFWITFNFWWLAGLVDGIEPCVPPLCSQKNEMFIFGLRSTSDDRSDWLMDSNPICHPSPAKKMKCSFLGYVQLLMIGQAGQWTRTPSASPLQCKTWNAHFWITFNFWWSAGLVNGLEPHLQPLSSQKKWNAHFWITFNFWWSAGLVNGLECHPPPLSSQKHEMLVFGLHSTSDDWLGWLMDSNPICHPSLAKKNEILILEYVQLLMIGRAGRWTWTPSTTSLQPQKWNAHFWITFNFWWLAGLVDGLEPCVPPLCSHKKWNAHFWVMFNFWWSARLVDGLEPHLQPLSSQKEFNAHFWITFNFWCSAGLVDGLKPHLPPLSSQKHEMLIFGLHSTSNDRPGWSMDSNSICHPSPAKKWNACFWITFNFWWSVGLVDGIEPHLPPLSSQKNEMLIFGLRSTSDDWPGWSMDLSPVCHLSAAKKMKCPFLDYIQLLMIGRAGPWTPTPSATPLQPKKWNANFRISFNFWWLAGLVDGLKQHLQPLSSQKKWNAHF